MVDMVKYGGLMQDIELESEDPKIRNGSKVEEIMTTQVITTTPERDIGKVARILDEKRIKRLPVVDENNKLIGIISRANIVRHLGKQ